jgi:cobalt-zinc-cadmium resistance protein CzcA
MKRILLYSITIGLFCPHLYAQKEFISLEKALIKGVKNYPSIRQASLEVDRQKARKPMAWEFGKTKIIHAGEEIGNGNGVYTLLGIQQSNMDIFGIAPKSKWIEEQAISAEQKRNIAILQLQYAIKVAYGKLFTSKARKEVYEQLDTLYQRFRFAAELREKTGASSGLEVLAAKNEALQVKNNLMQAQDDYAIYLQKFNKWMNSDTVFDIPLSLPVTGKTDTSSGSIQQHPVIQAAQQDLEVAASWMAVQQSQLLPKLSAQYGIQNINNQRGFQAYQVGLTVPLFFMPEKAAINEAKIKKEHFASALEQKEIEFQNELLTTQIETAKWRRSWHYYEEEGLVMAQKLLDGSFTAYEQGAISYTTHIQNIKNALDIKLKAWDSYEKYLSSHFKLEYLLNR